MSKEAPEKVAQHPKAKAARMQDGRFQSAEFKRATWHATPEVGISLEDMLNPEYWAHVAGKLKSLDRIEVLAEDGTWHAELIVLVASRISARVAVLSHVALTALTDADVDMPDTHEISFGGPAVRWRVIRRSDKHVERDGFPTKDEAREWLFGHLKSLAA